MTASPPETDVVAALRGRLVVSCQAAAGHPLARPSTIAAIARCAELGGAAAVRIEGVDDVRAVRAVVAIPVMGLVKVPVGAGRRPFITPAFEDCRALVEAGAGLVAIEATDEYRTGLDGDPRSRAGLSSFAELCARVRAELGVPVVADVSSRAEGLAAASIGAELVSTTLSGYTRSSSAAPAAPVASVAARDRADLELAGELAASGVRTVLEGRVRRPEEVTAAFERGVWSVVVGTAITDPLALTRWYAAAAPGTPGSTSQPSREGI